MNLYKMYINRRTAMDCMAGWVSTAGGNDLQCQGFVLEC